MKECSNELAPFHCKLGNQSLAIGQVPVAFKEAVIKPLLKKPNLDNNDLENFRPVSNFPFISKLLERIVSVQLTCYLEINKLNNEYQSAYRKNGSTETERLRCRMICSRLLISLGQQCLFF